MSSLVPRPSSPAARAARTPMSHSKSSGYSPHDKPSGRSCWRVVLCGGGFIWAVLMVVFFVDVFKPVKDLGGSPVVFPQPVGRRMAAESIDDVVSLPPPHGNLSRIADEEVEKEGEFLARQEAVKEDDVAKDNKKEAVNEVPLEMADGDGGEVAANAKGSWDNKAKVEVHTGDGEEKKENEDNRGVVEQPKDQEDGESGVAGDETDPPQVVREEHEVGRSGDCRGRSEASAKSDVSIVMPMGSVEGRRIVTSVEMLLKDTPGCVREVLLMEEGLELGRQLRGGAEGRVEELEKLAANHREASIRIVRRTRTAGVTAVVQEGIEEAKSEIVVVLPPHVEVVEGWLQPLLQRVESYPKALVIPSVGQLDVVTLERTAHEARCGTGFTWGLRPRPVSSLDVKASSDGDETFHQTPVLLAPYAFAVNRATFLEMDGFDEKFENSEDFAASVAFALKWWSCGGVIECSKCSTIFVPPHRESSRAPKDSMRTVTIWFDRYADIAWRALSQPQVEIESYKAEKRKRTKQCNNFEWYLANVYTPMRPQSLESTAVSHLGPLTHATSNNCLEILKAGEVHLSQCGKRASQQLAFLESEHQVIPIVDDHLCLTSNSDGVTVKSCSAARAAAQIWIFDEASGRVQQEGGTKCLDVLQDERLRVIDCAHDSKTQIWSIPKYSPPSEFSPPAPKNLRGRDTD